MHTRKTITHALGALGLLAAVGSQAALAPLTEYTDPAAFQARLASLGLETRYEGFEPFINSVPTPWEPALSSDLKEVVVPDMGVRWFHMNDLNSRFGITTNRENTQKKKYTMNLPEIFNANETMSYTVETSGFKLVAFGGWFKDNDSGSKPKFTVDDGRSVEPNDPLLTTWQFLGFIDEDPNGGFTQVFVTELEGVNQVEFFFTDGVTLAAQQFPPIPIPAALPLFGSALVGLGFVARRRKKA